MLVDWNGRLIETSMKLSFAEIPVPQTSTSTKPSASPAPTALFSRTPLPPETPQIVAFEVLVIVPPLPERQLNVNIYPFVEKASVVGDLKGMPAECSVVIPPVAERPKPNSLSVGRIIVSSDPKGGTNADLEFEWMYVGRDMHMPPAWLQKIQIGEAVSERFPLSGPNLPGPKFIRATFDQPLSNLEKSRVQLQLKGMQGMVDLGIPQSVTQGADDGSLDSR